jgi:hexosaminidase
MTTIWIRRNLSLTTWIAKMCTCNFLYIFRTAAILSLLAVGACDMQSTKVSTDKRVALSLIPAPVLVDATPGFFILREGAVLNVRSTNAEAVGVARHFGDLLARTRSIHLDVRPFGGADRNDGIVFVIDPNLLVRDDATDEGYELTVSSDHITVGARTPHGLFNGSVTLWQLLTQNDSARRPLQVDCVHIEDYPRFAWRGLMLDSARHFQSPEFVEKLIDAMAIHKLNVLHWHLTDDQGWRLQIKQYPKLTEIGAWRTPAHVVGDPPRYGGFYTQDQVRDIVRYAAQRYITIVPEIEMPGHAQAAIAAYPEFGITGKRPPVSADWGVHTYLYNVDASTFEFLQNVLSEVIDLFPGPYIHVGGDEAAKDQWHASSRVQQRMRELHVANEEALQSYFIARIEKFVNAQGKKLVGWDEILQGGLAPRTTVMSWQGTKGGIEAAKQGHDVVMSPSPTMYLDHVQSTLHDEPPGRPDVVSLAHIYNYEPVPAELNAAQAKHVIGAQANLWTEYMDSPQRIEHAAFPRVAALAEALWSSTSSKNFDGFVADLPAQFARYRMLGIAYADSAFAPEIHITPNADGSPVTVELSDQVNAGEFRYTLDGSHPTTSSTAYRTSFPLKLPSVLNVADFDGGIEVATRSLRIDAVSLLRKGSDELQSCNPGGGLPLRLPGPSIDGREIVYRVDIFDPCWIFPAVDLDAIHHVDIVAAERPYNFQLWKDIDKVVTRPSAHGDTELQIHLDTCSGTTVAAIPLAGAVEKNGVAHLNTALQSASGKHDLCFVFARATANPLWVIDTVQLRP